ncbi:MAG: NADH-quinone oxidoreductase subunit NuoE [Proteobacteria bacterium]|jgi:NADH:ubiquinone oxidoreductase subunit E|nr:NADH-quinone oxidoreductase subunit NuoE [Pseudomonadota bacterium]NLN62160.1 NADH-quinone oxidoreductase subunit NuoE [Myxococcales bacterium]
MNIDLTQVDAIVARVGTDANLTIPVLQEVQEAFRYIPLEAIERIAATTDMTESQLYGVATFYAQFRLAPVGEQIIKVCHGTACHVGGAEGLTESLETRLGIRNGENTPDMKYTLEAVACVGCCSLAPVVMVGERTFGSLDRRKAAAIVDELEERKDAK